MSTKPVTPSKASPSKTGAPDSTKSGTGADATIASSALDLLEEDDEFEEFEGASWDDAKAQTDVQALYIDNWDDDGTNLLFCFIFFGLSHTHYSDADDDFTKQLREEIDKAQK